VLIGSQLLDSAGLPAESCVLVAGESVGIESLPEMSLEVEVLLDKVVLAESTIELAAASLILVED
jgi:hypothetical protein